MAERTIIVTPGDATVVKYETDATTIVSTDATGPAGPGYAATSTTSLAIGTGSKSFTTQSGLAFLAGLRVRAVSAANSANYMEGTVTSYSGTTLVVSVDVTGGSGTLADWNLGIAAAYDALNATLMDAKGDTIVASAADTPARLAVGAEAQVYVARSSSSTGVAWETVEPTPVNPPQAPALIVPPGAVWAASSLATWYVGNSATFMRFSIDTPRTYRYVNLYVGASSGNIQVGVLRLRDRATAGSTTGIRVASSGVMACPSANSANRIDLGYFTLTPGDYALFLWCDNTTATFMHGLVTGATASRMLWSGSGYTTGVPATATTISGTTRWVSGLTLESPVLPAAALGDSIVGGDNADPAGAGSWLSLADANSGYRVYPWSNGGVAGNTTTQMLARAATVFASQRYALVLGGTNDVGNDISAATIQANLASIYDAAISAGVVGLICCTIPPRSNVAASAAALTPARAAVLKTVNAWIRANYTSWSGARLCDWSWALSDKTDESSPLAANFSDYVHPSATGSAIMAAALVKAMRDWV